MACFNPSAFPLSSRLLLAVWFVGEGGCLKVRLPVMYVLRKKRVGELLESVHWQEECSRNYHAGLVASLRCDTIAAHRGYG